MGELELENWIYELERVVLFCDLSTKYSFIFALSAYLLGQIGLTGLLGEVGSAEDSCPFV